MTRWGRRSPHAGPPPHRPWPPAARAGLHADAGTPVLITGLLAGIGFPVGIGALRGAGILRAGLVRILGLHLRVVGLHLRLLLRVVRRQSVRGTARGPARPALAAPPPLPR